MAVFFFQRLEKFYFFRGNQFPFGNDYFSVPDHSLSKTNIFKLIEQLELRFGSIKFQVGLNVIVQVQTENMFFRALGKIGGINPSKSNRLFLKYTFLENLHPSRCYC